MTILLLLFLIVFPLNIFGNFNEPELVKLFPDNNQLSSNQYLQNQLDNGCELVDENKIQNDTYKIRDGKMYKVTYVKKRKKCSENPLISSRRTDGRAIFNDTNTSMARIWQFWTSSHPVTTATVQRKQERFKKLLNLFTIVKFDNGGCIVNGLKGTCYHQRECVERGGRTLGPCARGFGVCCYIERTCGSETRENCTYFVNQGFPEESRTASGVCSLSVFKANQDVKQFRVEFETFELKGPINGTCLQDRFIVTGQNRNSIVPDICGYNSGSHIYVDVDGVNGPINFNFVTMGTEVGRKFRVKITQLRLGDELLAPQNCLQYYTELQGIIYSFNYQHQITENAAESAPAYFNNLNYVICIRKGPSFCTITYANTDNSDTETDFQLINYDSGGLIVPRGQAGAEVFNCPDDYIAINGVRLCGDRINDATVELDYVKSYPVTDTGTGPGQFLVRTNDKDVARGFYLKYRQNPCVD